MKNIQRHFFSLTSSSMEYAVLHDLGDPASWEAQVWIDYVTWLTTESDPNAPIIVESNPTGHENEKVIEQINHPNHYRHRSGFDAIVWIDRYSLDFCEGNCFKYLFRRGEKIGESQEKDENKAKWYFKHKALQYAECSLVTWEEAKKKVFDKLSYAFGPAGKLPDGSLDWSKGGCDMPEAIEFMKDECMTMLKD